MTALNLISQPHAAYLLVDAATRDNDGRVSHIARKTVLSQRLGAVFAWTGHAPACELADRYVDMRAVADTATSHVQLRQSLERLAISYTTRNREVSIGADREGVSIGLAYWNVEKGEPETWLFRGDAEEGQTATRLRCAVNTGGPDMPIPGFPSATSTSFSNPNYFDPWQDARALFEAQRRSLLDDLNHPVIGGFAEVYECGPDGVTSAVVKRWPDRIGHVIDPDATWGSMIVNEVAGRCERLNANGWWRFVAATSAIGGLGVLLKG